MNWTLEVVVVPISDVDRDKAFCADQVGFNIDHDITISDELRVVQFVAPDIRAAHAQLVERGVDADEIQILSDPDGNDWAVQQITLRG